MTQHLETTPVHFHDCRVLGNNVKLPRAFMADGTSTYVLYYQFKCPFCSTTAGERVLARGVTQNPDGSFSVDVTKAELLRSPE